jgi:hypothetical protein
VSFAQDEEHISKPTEDIDSSPAGGWWKVICLSKDSLKTMLHNRPGTAKSSDFLHLWYELVEKFSTRMITFKTDTLPAILGIAREI